MTRVVVVTLVVLPAIVGGCSHGEAGTTPSPASRIPVGVLGDSDSHSYHDSVLLPEQANRRGGEYRATTFQWTELWARLRPTEVDLGDWGTWGTRGTIAEAMSLIGLEGRAPRKQDYRFNMAISGARCEHLTESMGRQAPRLLYLMNQDPQRWAKGIVIIRIGINSLGTTEDLEAYAASGLTAETRAKVTGCAKYVDDAVAMLRTEHPTTRIVLVGIFDDTNWAANFDKWRNAKALANITAVLDAFDASLRATAARDANIAFADDRRWFVEQWGSRTADGVPSYREIAMGGATPVTNSIGDHPRNMTLQDGHAGTVQNGLWLMDLVKLLNERWGYGFTPIQVEEIASLADPKGSYGLSAARR